MRVRVVIAALVVVSLCLYFALPTQAGESPQSGEGKPHTVLGATLGGPFSDVVNAYNKTSYGTIREKDNVLVYPALLTSLSHFSEKEVEYWSWEDKLAQMVVRFEGTELTCEKLLLVLTSNYGEPTELDKNLQKERPMLKEWFSRKYSGLKISLDVVGMPTIMYKYLPLTIPMEDAEVEKF